MKDMLMSKSN